MELNLPLTVHPGGDIRDADGVELARCVIDPDAVNDTPEAVRLELAEAFVKAVNAGADA